jgi:hypothetical protein
VKQFLGMLFSVGAMVVLLGTLTGCPDTKTKTTDVKKTEVEKKDSGTKTTTEEKKVEETKKKDS